MFHASIFRFVRKLWVEIKFISEGSHLVKKYLLVFFGIGKAWLDTSSV